MMANENAYHRHQREYTAFRYRQSQYQGQEGALKGLIKLNQLWKEQQRFTPLGLPPCQTDSYGLLQSTNEYVQTFMLEQHEAQNELDPVHVQRLIFGTAMLECPKTVTNSTIEVDQATLFIQATGKSSNVRSETPSFRLRFPALTKNGPIIPRLSGLSCVLSLELESECIQNEIHWQQKQMHKPIPLQRQGKQEPRRETRSPKIETLENSLKITVSQRPTGRVAGNFVKFVNCFDEDEMYLDGALCLNFFEIGFEKLKDVSGHKMHPALRRYRIRIDCQLFFDNDRPGLVQSIYSHPFVVCSSKEECTMTLAMAWSILTGHQDVVAINSTGDRSRAPVLPWGLVRQLFANAVFAGDPNARLLDRQELLMLQCKLFMSILAKNKNHSIAIFADMFHQKPDATMAKCHWRYRLLHEFVRDDYSIHVDDLLIPCQSLYACDAIVSLPCTWAWLFNAVNIITNSRLSMNDTPKTTVIFLFNTRLLTMIDTDSVWKIFRSLLKRELRTPVMLLRLCEDNAGFICPAYSNRNTTINSFPLQSHITAKEVADAKRGIASIFDLQSANDYTHLVQLKVRSNASTYPIRTSLSPTLLLHPGRKRSSQEPPDDPYMRPRKLSTCSTVYSLQASPSHVEQPRTPLSTVVNQESTYQLAETNEIDIEIALELVKEEEQRSRSFDKSPLRYQPMEFLCQPMEFHDQLSINSRPRSATTPDSSRYMENNASIQRATDGFSQDYYIATPLIEKIFGKSEGDMTKPFIAIPQLEIDPRTGTAIPIDVYDHGRNNRRAMLGHDLHRDSDELSIVGTDLGSLTL